MVQEHLKIFLHLDAVIIHLSNREDTHLTFSPNLAKNNLFLSVHITTIADSEHISLESFMKTCYKKMESKLFLIVLALC